MSVVTSTKIVEKAAPEKISVRSVLESLLAGAPARSIGLDLQRLSTRLERQAVLCTACGMQEDVAASCRQRGEQTEAFLSRYCQLFELDRKPCMLQQVYGVSLNKPA